MVLMVQARKTIVTVKRKKSNRKMIINITNKNISCLGREIRSKTASNKEVMIKSMEIAEKTI